MNPDRPPISGAFPMADFSASPYGEGAMAPAP
jgi:hypothetical protein